MENDTKKKELSFFSIFWLYTAYYFSIGTFPVNIQNYLDYLPGATTFGLGIYNALGLFVGIVSLLIFGYYGNALSKKFTRKKLYIYTNLMWVIAVGVRTFSVSYYDFLIVYLIGVIGAGSFLPVGFSLIGDLYPPEKRGKKFGTMNLGIMIGWGGANIFGGLIGELGGPIGWRLANGLSTILGVLALVNFKVYGYDPSGDDFKAGNEKIRDYKITLDNLSQVLKKKSLIAIYLFVLCSGVATQTLGVWAIYYLTSKIGTPDAGLYATILYLLIGIGGLPGTILGGKFGDKLFESGKSKGRVFVSMGGVLVGVLFQMGFYLIPFFGLTTMELVLSWMFFLVIGLIGTFFAAFSVGNQYAIFTEVCHPGLRSTANAINGVMVNIGGIIGNLILTSIIESDISLLPFSIWLVLFVYLMGTFLWIIPYIYYPREAKECADLMANKTNEKNN